eukprot:IDg15294t1
MLLGVELAIPDASTARAATQNSPARRATAATLEPSKQCSPSSTKIMFSRPSKMLIGFASIAKTLLAVRSSP